MPFQRSAIVFLFNRDYTNTSNKGSEMSVLENDEVAKCRSRILTHSQKMRPSDSLGRHMAKYIDNVNLAQVFHICKLSEHI